MIEYTSRDAECIAYLSALVTLELCAEIHHKGKPNTAIRKCCAGCLQSLRSWLEEMAQGQVVLEK